MESDLDGEEAISALNDRQVGSRKLKVEWAKGQGPASKIEDGRSEHAKPTSTLFICNFDPRETDDVALERHFEKFGSIKRTHIKRNFAFMEFETVAGAQVRVHFRTIMFINNCKFNSLFNSKKECINNSQQAGFNT
jgi:RNA recognition motif-containing protein